MSKLLQVIGVLALLGWTGAGFGAWMLTKEQVHVTIEEGAAERLAQVDPAVELADRLEVLKGDLRGLGQSLGQNFQVLEEAADERDAEARQALTALNTEWRAELLRIERQWEAQLKQRLQAAQENHAREREIWRTELAGLREALAQVSNTKTAEALTSNPAAANESVNVAQANDPSSASESEAGLDPTPVVPSEPVVETPAQEQPIAELEPSKPKKKRSFVAFDLPSDSFSFEGRRQWDLIPSLSRVGFDAKSTLHDFTGATQKVEGQWTVDLSDAAADPQGVIRADASSLDTGLADRNTAMYEKLNTAKHAKIEFEISAFRPLKVERDALKLRGTVVGKLRIQGVEREIEMPVALAIDDARRLEVVGELNIQMSKWDIEPPSQLGMISVRDEVRMWIALRARAQAVSK